MTSDEILGKIARARDIASRAKYFQLRNKKPLKNDKPLVETNADQFQLNISGFLLFLD